MALNRVRDDVLAQLLAHSLLQVQAVHDACGGRVETAYAEDPDAGTGEVPRIVLLVEGGSTEGAGSVLDAQVTLWALGATSDASRSLHAVACAAWDQERLEVSGLDHRGRVYCSRSGRTGWLPGPAVWGTSSRWRVQVVRDST